MLRRHDLLFVSASAWRSLTSTREDIAPESVVAGWVDNGWPLVVRRHLPDEAHGVPLGLPLPPSGRKRRLEILMRTDDIIAAAPPLALELAIGAAPPDWRLTLARVVSLARRHGVEARVFGSLAWHELTGLDYLSVNSDVDLLLPVRPDDDPAQLAAELRAIERTAPVRLDGEIVRDDGAAVNWRELDTGAPQLLVKTLHEATLWRADLFCSRADAP